METLTRILGRMVYGINLELEVTEKTGGGDRRPRRPVLNASIEDNHPAG